MWKKGEKVEANKKLNDGEKGNTWMDIDIVHKIRKRNNKKKRKNTSGLLGISGTFFSYVGWQNE